MKCGLKRLPARLQPLWLFSPRRLLFCPAAAPVAAPVAQPAAASAAPPSGAVTAPIPGVIVLISVKEGETVKKGQELVVLEAMKMKNSIRSNHDGVVGEIKVKIGEHVQHGQSLIEYKS